MKFRSMKIPWFYWPCVCVCVCVCVVIIHFASLRRSNFYMGVQFHWFRTTHCVLPSSTPPLGDCRRAFIAVLVNGMTDKSLNSSLPVNFNCPFGQVHGLWLVVKWTVGRACRLALHTQLYWHNYFTIISLWRFCIRQWLWCVFITDTNLWRT